MGLHDWVMFILCMVNAHALAHVTRALEVAKVLRERGHRIEIAGGGRHLSVASRDGFVTHGAEALTEEELLQAIHHGRIDMLLPLAAARRSIDAELRLYRHLQPDLVLVDDRATAVATAELLEIPTVSISNVHMTRYRARPFYTPRRTVLARLPSLCDLVEAWENRVELMLFDRLVMKSLVRVRSELGLTRRYHYDLGQGDLHLLADIPQFNPVSELPDSAHFIGPLTWKSGLGRPRALDRLEPTKKTIYFTMGSTGLLELVEKLARVSSDGLQFVVAAGKDVDPTVSYPDNVHVEKLVNADLVLPHCDLVICHGGNGTLYQAMTHGVPVIGIPAHAEQAYGLKRIEEQGLGVFVDAKVVQRRGLDCLSGPIQRVLDDRAYARRAQTFARELRWWDGPTLAADLIEEFARGRALISDDGGRPAEAPSWQGWADMAASS